MFEKDPIPSPHPIHTPLAILLVKSEKRKKYLCVYVCAMMLCSKKYGNISVVSKTKWLIVCHLWPLYNWTCYKKKKEWRSVQAFTFVCTTYSCHSIAVSDGQ